MIDQSYLLNVLARMVQIDSRNPDLTAGAPGEAEIGAYVAGLMAELGDEGPAEHRRIAELADELGVEVLAVGCGLYGSPWTVDSADDVVGALGKLGPDDVVLIKGSRVAGLERAAEALTRPGR